MRSADRKWLATKQKVPIRDFLLCLNRHVFSTLKAIFCNKKQENHVSSVHILNSDS
jgi:hypothetical protein